MYNWYYGPTEKNQSSVWRYQLICWDCSEIGFTCNNCSFGCIFAGMATIQSALCPKNLHTFFTFFFFFWSSKMSAKKNILLPPDQWYACVCVCVHVCMIMYICVCRMTLSPLCFTCNFHEVLICTPEYKILITQFNICCECACMCVCIFVCKWVCVCSVWITPFL